MSDLTRRHESSRSPRRARERAQRQHLLLRDLGELSKDFELRPDQVGRWLTEREQAGELDAEDAERAWTALLTWSGPEGARHALGRTAAPLDGAGWSVVDADRARALETRRLLQEFAPLLGLRPDTVSVRADEDARARTESMGAAGLMQEGRVFLRPNAYDPRRPEGRQLLAHELTHVAQRELAGRGDAAFGGPELAEREARTVAAGLATGGGGAVVRQGLAPFQMAADTGVSGGASQGQDVDVDALSEEELKTIVFIQEGPKRGRQRWNGKDSPNEPSPRYSYRSYKQAKARLDVLSTEHDGVKVTRPKDNIWKGPSNKKDSVSTTPESRAERRAADDRVAAAQDRLDEAHGKKEHKAGRKEVRSAERAREDVRAATRDPVGAHDKAVDARRDAEHDAKGRVGRALDHVDMQGDLFVKGVDARTSVYSERHDGVAGPLGSTREGKTSLLSANANARTRVGVGKDGVTAEAEAGAAAKLISFTEQMKWEFPFTVFGEAVNAKVYVQASGMAGVEAKAQIKANLQKRRPSGLKVDENGIQAGVEAFAGAKVSVGAGAALEWQKKPQQAYQAKMAQSGKVVVDLVTMANPPLGWCLRRLGGDKAAEKVLGLLFQWGQAGTVPLMALEAAVEGSAGIGGAARAGVSVRGGQFKFYAQAKGTLGLGIGGKTEVMLDVVEGPKFALIVLGELRPMAIQFIEQAAARGVQFASDTWNEIASWWSSDDKAREAVANGAHKVMPAPHARQLVDDMLGWWCGDEDQQSIVKVLTDLKAQGRLGSMGTDPAFRQRVLSKLDGAYHRQAAGVLGGTAWK